ncbi:hypothetical protein A6D6_01696 [Alcanivorax xiamenensis]|uniref:Transmembrane protein (PGPGW) n=1 Tax=Alcanivorax xiamenensis TaxID=1177156 RepID=A0ABQ6Y9H0_9GAMM|nr:MULTISPECIES: hypothetical protein [Alcanivorax]KAF0806361.1 hypothetical protein A6D6_01696 [Alcanivorax xiamenensis]
MTPSLPPWLHQLGQTLEPWFPALTLIGLLMAVISTLAIPWLVIRMPADYFTAERRPTRYRHPGHWLLWALRNALAIVLLAAGLLMLVLPGQGLLTMLIAVMVSTFPGKYRLERAIVRHRGVFRAVNWIRRRRRREPLHYPP